MTIAADLAWPKAGQNGAHSVKDVMARLEVEALTFDDVLLAPGYTETLPNEVDISVRLHPALDPEHSCDQRGHGHRDGE